MSARIFFSFSAGLKEPLKVPCGTLRGIQAHVNLVEQKLGLVRWQYKSNPPSWNYTDTLPGAVSLSDDELCRLVRNHNRWVRQLYRDFGRWQANPVEDGEVISPEEAQGFWQALRELYVPTGRWSPEYYVNRMEHLYEVLRGRESEGVQYDADSLTEKQAGAVIALISEYLDPEDHRLEVCRGMDKLTCSEDYRWCEKCGEAVHEDDAPYAVISCSSGEACPLREYDY